MAAFGDVALGRAAALAQGGGFRGCQWWQHYLRGVALLAWPLEGSISHWPLDVQALVGGFGGVALGRAEALA